MVTLSNYAKFGIWTAGLGMISCLVIIHYGSGFLTKPSSQVPAPIDMRPVNAQRAYSSVRTENVIKHPNFSFKGMSFEKRWANLIDAAESMAPAEFEDFITVWIAALKSGETQRALVLLQSGKGSTDLIANVTGRLVRHWVTSNPEAASDWVKTMPAGPARNLAMENLALGWATQDLSKALSWAATLPDQGEHNAALLAIANEAVRTQPDEALRLAVDLPASPQRDNLVRRAAVEYATQDQAAAIAWAKQISDEKLQARVISGISVAWSKIDPWGAGDLALNNLPEGRLKDDAIVGIAQRWAEQDPQSAASWISTFPPGDLRQAAIDSIVPIWAQHNARQASSWRKNVEKQAF